MLILVLVYWMIVILGLFDFDFLDFDLDLEGAEDLGILSGIFVFLNVAELPFMLFFSILVLNFWILSMLLHYLPIDPRGLINGMLLVFTLLLSMILTRFETLPLKGIFSSTNRNEDQVNRIIHEVCTLRCHLESGKLGQAEVERNGSSTVINVMAEFQKESFEKGDLAFVSRKDSQKDMYYIRKNGGVK